MCNEDKSDDFTRPNHLNDSEGMLSKNGSIGKGEYEIDKDSLIQQLKEHQAELETQNEELKRLQLELQESHELYEDLFEQAPVGYFLLDRRLFINKANLAARKMLGVKRADLFGSRFSAFLATEDRDRFYECFNARGEAINAKNILCQIEVKMHRLDGSFFYAELSILEESKPKSDWIYRVAVSDITAHKQAQEQLNDITEKLALKVDQRTAELKDRARQLQQLSMELSEAEECERKRLSEILHEDLQQLLVASKLQLSAIHRRHDFDSSIHDSISQVEKIIVEAIEKTRNLSHELSPGVLNQNDFSEAIRWLADQMEHTHRLRVRIYCRSSVDIRSGVIRILLYRTVQELLLNVVKHSGVNEANVRIRQIGKYVAISVSDRGIGFDLQSMGKKSGFGLLSIKDRVEVLGGRLKIRSSKGKGSRFVIALANDQKEIEPIVSESVLRPDAGLRVLVADDHEVIREGLVSLLNEEPEIKIVGEASNGREAIKLAHLLKPDVAMIDVLMPEISGVEIARFIKANVPETRVIALSMGNESELVENMFKAGADAHVIKTASKNEVIQIIRGAENNKPGRQG
jgi:PAS domain S-box-containing protein